jgi:DDB1- and CUL4-associated factor 7
MNSQGQYGTAPRRPSNTAATYSTQHLSDELHISPTSMVHTSGHMSPRDFTTAPGPQIKLDQPLSQPVNPQYQSSTVPNVLQPGRPVPMATNTAPSLPTMSGTIQQSPSEYSSPAKPSLSISHNNYSRSSPADHYDATTPSGYSPYAPTTPGGSANPGQSQYMSPQETKYSAGGSQRNVSHTPLGLADIRPRADSSLSDSQPGTMGYELANSQPSASNYLAPWALFAFDWCKWIPQGKGAGKVAIGSYLEDGHNYVCERQTNVSPRRPAMADIFHLRYKSSTPKSSTHPPTFIPPVPPSIV